MENYFSANNYPNSIGSSSVINSKEKKKCIAGGKRSSKGMKLSTDPQSVAARERRHRISDRFKILQSMVPGGTKMDTVSMLDEAIQYVKFLKTQIWIHQNLINFEVHDHDPSLIFPLSTTSLIPPDQQQSFYSNPNLLVPATVQYSSQLVPPPDSCFLQGQETMPYGSYINH